MRNLIILILLWAMPMNCYCWGFYAHKKINHLAVFLLPPQMMVLYKKEIQYITEHATDPDKRKSVVKGEGSKHYIDIDHYGTYPYQELPRRWVEAIDCFTLDSVNKYGTVPWQVEASAAALTNAFKEKNLKKILRISADIGHYIADAHVPLHTNSNHNGQFSNQEGIHGLWESRIPELLSEKQFNFFTGTAKYLSKTGSYIWDRVLESAIEADSVLQLENQLAKSFSTFSKYGFERKKGKLIKVYSTSYTVAYNDLLKGMVERRMQQSILSVASYWLTSWINAGQPDLNQLAKQTLTKADSIELNLLNNSWKQSVLDTDIPCRP